MTQAQVAEAMGTTQAVIARLASGRMMPSTRTLERFARATGTRLRIRFAPAAKPARGTVGKPKKLALTAAMRKLLAVLNALLRDGTPWRAPQSA